MPDALGKGEHVRVALQHLPSRLDGLQHAAESIKNYRGYPSRLEASNTVLSELNKEIVKWYGLAAVGTKLYGAPYEAPAISKSKR